MYLNHPPIRVIRRTWRAWCKQLIIITMWSQIKTQPRTRDSRPMVRSLDHFWVIACLVIKSKRRSCIQNRTYLNSTKLKKIYMTTSLSKILMWQMWIMYRILQVTLIIWIWSWSNQESNTTQNANKPQRATSIPENLGVVEQRESLGTRLP